jgi:F0F1-type ATP synthase assembly protein I
MGWFGRAGPYFAFFTEVGISLALSIFIGALLGIQLDRSLGTSPLLSLVGLFSGMLLGGFATYRLMERFLARFPASGGRRNGDGSGQNEGR